MEQSRVIVISLFILLQLFTQSRGCPRGRHHKHEIKKEETAKSRSYIDIDASDPFKVPKSSHYINKPMPEFDKMDTKEDEESDNRKGHGRYMERDRHNDDSNEEESKNMGRGNDREGESERDRGEKDDRDRDSEGENYAENEDHAGMMQSPVDEQVTAQAQEEMGNAPKDLDMSDNAKAIEKIEQDAEGKSMVQNNYPDSMGAEELYKKGNTDPNNEEEMPIDKNAVNQVHD